MREKRQHHRAELRVPVRVVTDGEHSFETQSLDISQGGMFLMGQSPVALGSAVELAFDMPSLGPIVVPAFIRWNTDVGFGVQFGLIGARETHAIGQLIFGQAS